MKWEKDGAYCIRSADGKYRVTKTSHTSGDWRYAAIFAKQVIGTGISAEQMKRFCETHRAEACANYGRRGK